MHIEVAESCGMVSSQILMVSQSKAEMVKIYFYFRKQFWQGVMSGYFLYMLNRSGQLHFIERSNACETVIAM